MEENKKVVEINNVEETLMVEKKHPIRDFINNHPVITAVVTGVLAALGGYTVGNLMADGNDEVDDDWIGDPVIEETTEVTE